MDVPSNVFCASGMHLPNGSYVTFGGNNAVAPGGGLGSQVYPGGGSASWDSTLQDFDGSRSIRILNPCTSADNFASSNCQWFDDSTLLAMKKQRWYSAAEPLGDGTVVIIGGFVLGGYVNRMYPNTDPQFEQGQAESTFEFFPAKSGTPQVMQFLIKTSGLNAYAHTFLMPSGKMFLQANTSSSRSTIFASYLINTNPFTFCSVVGCQCQCRDCFARHAQQRCSRLPSIWCGCHVTSYSSKQLCPDYPFLRWARHALV